MKQLNSKRLKNETLVAVKIKMDNIPNEFNWLGLNERDKDNKDDLSESFMELTFGEAVLLLGYVDIYIIDYEGNDTLIEDDDNSMETLKNLSKDGIMFAIERNKLT